MSAATTCGYMPKLRICTCGKTHWRHLVLPGFVGYGGSWLTLFSSPPIPALSAAIAKTRVTVLVVLPYRAFCRAVGVIHQRRAQHAIWHTVGRIVTGGFMTQPPLTEDERQALREISDALAEQLGETETAPRIKLWRIVRVLGRDEAMALLDEARAIEAQ